MKTLSAVILAALLFQASAASAGPARFGCGFAVSEGGTVDDAGAQALIEKALGEALRPFGEAPPKGVVFIENTRRAGGIRNGMKKAGGVPCYGVDTAAYQPLGLAAFPARDERVAVSVLAVGGDVEVKASVVEGVVMPVKDWEWKDRKNPDGTKWSESKIQEARGAAVARHVAWGEELARPLAPPAGDARTHVVLQLGCQHVPRMTWVTAGCRKALPPAVHLLGVAAADFGNVHTPADTKGNRLLGVRISGAFRVAVAGAGEPDEGKQVGLWREKTEAALKEIGGAPDAAILFACATWHNRLEEKRAIAAERLQGIPVFGAFGGGEIGAYTTGGETVSLPGQFFIAVFKGGP